MFSGGMETGDMKWVKKAKYSPEYSPEYGIPRSVAFMGWSYIFLGYQKQSPEMFYEKRCSWKFWKIPVLESLFNNVTGLQACKFIKKSF